MPVDLQHEMKMDSIAGAFMRNLRNLQNSRSTDRAVRFGDLKFFSFSYKMTAPS